MESEDDDMGADGVPMVRLGDASVSAPFTSRSPSIQCVIDIVRQGRCTLLSALQQQQIMMLESLISAYVLSALSLEGARSSERQMIASSWLLMIASVAFSYATPVDQMHPQRPLRSLFHPAIFVSMAGQAAIHLWTMHQAVTLARDEMGPDKLAEVVEFHRKGRLHGGGHGDVVDALSAKPAQHGRLPRRDGPVRGRARRQLQGSPLDERHHGEPRPLPLRRDHRRRLRRLRVGHLA